MTKLEGHEIDIEQSSDGTNDIQWRLVFTPALYKGPGVSKTVEPVQFVLKRKDYSNKIPKGYYIFFDPSTNKYQIISKDEIENQTQCYEGINIGGFIVTGFPSCKLTFVYPKCTDDVTYVRPWTEEFTEAYEKRQLSCEDQEEMCGAFKDFEFNEDFEIDCPIVEDNNAFDYGAFDRGEFETIPPDLNP